MESNESYIPHPRNGGRYLEWITFVIISRYIYNDSPKREESTRIEVFSWIKSTGMMVDVMPQPKSQTRDNCRIPLSGIQFLRIPLKDPQDTIDNHHPFEITIYNNHTN